MKKLPFLSARKLGAKPFIILALVLLFLIPLHLVRSLVRDRETYRDAAIESVLEPLGGKPVVEGFCIVVPYEVTEKRELQDGTLILQTFRRTMALFPESCSLTAEADPYTLTRGIFEVPVFSCTAVSTGSFSSARPVAERAQASSVLWQDALFCVGISNKKNITMLPEILADGRRLALSADSLTIPMFTTSLLFALPEECAKNGFSFSVRQELQGGESLSIRPVAAANTFSVSSSWKSPSFGGGWLPATRELSDKGFSAVWKIPGFSTNFPEAIVDMDSWRGRTESVNVSLVSPVDNYQRTTRSVKYGILFLMIPFIVLLVLELFTAVRIHPVQYALIGLADVLFYLMLLSISEHLPFSAAYWLSTAAVCLLALFYAAAIFRRKQWGAVFSAVQLILYIFLFGTLQAEDYALLIGTLGLLASVALLMMLTRKVDWYADENTAEEAQ